MNKQLSGFELNYIIRELQLVVGGKVDKIFQSSDLEFYIRTHTASVGKTNIRIFLPSLIYASQERSESLDYPKGFCMMLRKRLSNSRIRSITQLGMERIVQIVFETHEVTYQLVIELFGKGNLILCSNDMVIIGALVPQITKNREIKAGNQYQTPGLRPSIRELSQKQFTDIIKPSTKGNLAKVLAIELGLGGILAEELCIRSNVDKGSDPKQLSDENYSSLFNNCLLLLEIPLSAKIVSKDGISIDALPFSMSIYAQDEAKDYDSFSSALDAFHEINPSQSIGQKPKLTKNDKIVEAQSKIVSELQTSIENYTAQANLIYEHYQELSTLLKEISDQKGNKSWEEIRQIVLSYPFVVDLDLKEKKITVEF